MQRRQPALLAGSASVFFSILGGAVGGARCCSALGVLQPVAEAGDDGAQHARHDARARRHACCVPLYALALARRSGPHWGASHACHDDPRLCRAAAAALPGTLAPRARRLVRAPSCQRVEHAAMSVFWRSLFCAVYCCSVQRYAHAPCAALMLSRRCARLCAVSHVRIYHI
jgi:hypothetical protein